MKFIAGVYNILIVVKNTWVRLHLTLKNEFMNILGIWKKEK